MKRIDVLLPFHRNDEYLMAATQSVLDSESVKLRIVLIDDRINQSDTVRKLWQDSNIDYVQTAGGVGYGAAIALGLNYSDSDVVALMNSDDLVHPQRLVKQLKILENSDVCISKMQRFSKSKFYSSSIMRSLSGQHYSSSFLLLGSYGADATWLCQRTWLLKHWVADDKPALDWRIALRNFQASQICFVPEVLYYYRRHSLQTSRTKLDVKDRELLYSSWLEAQSAKLMNFANREVFSIMAMPWDEKVKDSISPLSRWINQFLSEIESSEPLALLEAQALVARRLKIALSQRPLRIRRELSKVLSLAKYDDNSLVKDLIQFLL